MKLRSDYRAAVLIKNRLHHESREPIEEPIHIRINKDEYNKEKKFSPKVTSQTLELTNIQDGNIGLQLQVPRGGTNGIGSEHFRVRELVKKIENHPHRQDLQADLQQSNACKPFSEESKVMIRDMGNVELFEICEPIPKAQCSEYFLYWNQGIVCCTCGHLLKESEASQHCHQWRLDAFSIENYSSRRGDLEVLGTAKLKHRKSISWPTMRGGDVSKRNVKEFTIASNEIQHFVICNSKLAGLRRSASRWTK